MKLYRISLCKYIDDLTGTGAEITGGRWNSKGIRVLYTAQSASLAMLEVVARINNTVVEAPYCMIVLEVPNDSIKEFKSTELTNTWDNFPAEEQTRLAGDKFVNEQKALLLKVPSIIVPEEHNYIINPAHNRFTDIKVVSKRNISFDKRFIK
jgi:RES domain-containing protein